MRITAVAVAVVAFLGGVAPGAAQESVDTLSSGESWFDQFRDPLGSEEFGFQLYNGCSPVRLTARVRTSPSLGNDHGVTQARIRDLAESRLRGARLYAESGDLSASVLWIGVNIVDGAFSIDLEFWKVVDDRATRRSELAETWTTGRLVGYGGDADDVMHQVSEGVDRFLLEFFRENEDACGGP